MAPEHGSIGHDQLTDALERLLWIEPNPRVLTVVGSAGVGVSTALRAAAVEAEQGYKVVRVSLTHVLADDAIYGGLPDDPALRLMQTLAVRIAALAPGWRRGSLAKEAADLDDLPDDLDVTALSGGVETSVADTPLTVRVGGVREGVRRRWWVAGLSEVARRLRRTRFVLVVDDAELLGVFDPVRRAARVPGAVASEHVTWFADQVLPALLDTAPHLRVVFGSTSRVLVGPVPDDHVTLRPWTAEQTAAYLASRGQADTELGDTELGDAVHAVCGGSPLVTAELTRHLVGQKAEAVADTVKELTELAGAGPVGDWLPARLLDQLGDDAERELVLAAATLRVVSDEALHALSPDAATDRTRLAKLRADWSSDTYDDAAGEPVWRMHPLLRDWLLDHAEAASRDDAAKRHLAAAEYYEGLADADAGSNAQHVEATYHRIAAGDYSRVGAWREQLVGAVRDGRLGRVHALASAAERPHGRATASLATASLAAAYAGYLRGDLVSANAAATAAVDELDQLDKASDEAAAQDETAARSDGERLAALELAGQLDWLAWRCRDAAQHWLDAVEFGRDLRVLCAAGEAALACGELLVADDVLDEAYSLVDDVDEVDAGEDSEDSGDSGASGASAGDEPASEAAFPRLPLGTLGDVDDDGRAVSLLRWLGETAAALGETERAEVLLDQAEQRATTTGSGSDPQLLADILRLKAQLPGNDAATSEDLLERAHATARGRADRVSLAKVLLAQAALERRRTEPTDAPAPSAEPALPAEPKSHPADIPAPAAIPALERVTPAPLVGDGPVTDAEVAARYRQRRAANLAAAALDLAVEIGHAPVQAAALALTGDYDEALALTRRIGDRRGELVLALELGLRATEAGEGDTAMTYLRAAAEVAEEVGDAPNAERAQRALVEILAQNAEITP